MPGICGITTVGSSLQLFHPTPYGEDLDGGSRLEMVPSAYEDRLSLRERWEEYVVVAGGQGSSCYRSSWKEMLQPNFGSLRPIFWEQPLGRREMCALCCNFETKANRVVLSPTHPPPGALRFTRLCSFMQTWNCSWGKWILMTWTKATKILAWWNALNSERYGLAYFRVTR